MNIKITTTNFEKTTAIEEYVMKKISSLERFLNTSGEILCEVELGKTTEHHKSGDIFKAEVNIVCPGNVQFYAVAEEADLYTAIDIVRDEVEQLIVNKKKKRETLFKRGALKFKNLLKRLHRN